MVGSVMLTGATGYLGRAVLRELLTAEIRVHALVRDAGRLEPRTTPGLVACEGDLLDRASLVAAAHDVDAIVHVAGLVTDWVRDPAEFERINVAGTRNVIAAARECGVSRVLATSTVMVFGPTDGLLAASEQTPRPNKAHFLPYQRTKAQALDLLREGRGADLHVQVVFPGALYGPGPLTDGNYLARVMQALETGAFPVLPRTKGVQWCLSHVDDVAHGHLLALRDGDPDGEWILGGENVSFDRMLELMRAGLGLAALPPRVPGGLMMAGVRALALWHGLTGTPPPITIGGGQALLHDWAFSSAHARRTLGYRFQPFEEAFPHFVKWYAETTRQAAALSDSGELAAAEQA